MRYKDKKYNEIAKFEKHDFLNDLPPYTITPFDLFSGDEKIIEESSKQISKIIEFWYDLLNSPELDKGISIESENGKGLQTLTKSLELDNAVRYSSFIKINKKDQWEAILHNEYNLEKNGENSISSLVQDYLFSLSKEKGKRMIEGEKIGKRKINEEELEI